MENNSTSKSPTAQIFSLADGRKAKAKQVIQERFPQLFEARPFAQDDFKNMQGGLLAFAGMVKSGVLGDRATIAALLEAYSHHARIAEMTAQKTFSRAAKAERRMRWLERKAKKKAKA